MGPATKMVPGRRIYINIKKSESNFFLWEIEYVDVKILREAKKSVTTLVTCLCHGNLFPLYLVHTEKSVAKEAPLRETEKSFFSRSPPFDECTDCFLPNDMLAASFASHKKQ